MEKKAKSKKAAQPRPTSGGPKQPKGIKVRKLVDVRIPYLGSSYEGTVSQEEFSRLSNITIDGKAVIERRSD
jgi:hypothetical protein